MDEDWNDDEDATIPCPYCGRPIYDDAPRCPHCENYLSDEEAAPARQPWWVILGVILVLLLVLQWMRM